MGCCDNNSKKRRIKEISAPDSEHKNKRKFNYIPVISIAVVAIVIIYLLNI